MNPTENRFSKPIRVFLALLSIFTLLFLGLITAWILPSWQRPAIAQEPSLPVPSMQPTDVFRPDALSNDIFTPTNDFSSIPIPQTGTFDPQEGNHFPEARVYANQAIDFGSGQSTTSSIAASPIEFYGYARSQQFHSKSASQPATMHVIEKLRGMKLDDPAREATMAELSTELAKEFDTMHSQQAKEIESLEQRLKTLKNSHDQRTKAKNKIVERRAKQLLGEPDEYRWEPNDAYNSQLNSFLYGRQSVPSKPVLAPPFTRALPNETYAPPLPPTRNLPPTAHPGLVIQPQTLDAMVQESVPVETFELRRRIAKLRSELDYASKVATEYKRLHQQGAVGTEELAKCEASEKSIRQSLTDSIDALKGRREMTDSQLQSAKERFSRTVEPTPPESAVSDPATFEAHRQFTQEFLLRMNREKLINDLTAELEQIDKAIEQAQPKATSTASEASEK